MKKKMMMMTQTGEDSSREDVPEPDQKGEIFFLLFFPEVNHVPTIAFLEERMVM